ncbi:MAG: DUF721 domain-containing protein [Methylococcales bacterium]|nr:DUF721 domain-containing protein [Methylococcales bacterium]
MNTFKTVKTYHLQIIKKHQKKIQQHLALLNVIKKNLTKPLSDHILHCTLLKDVLFIYTDSALWSSQLHFYQPILLKALASNDFSIVKSLHIKIILSTPSVSQKASFESPSEKNIALIRQCSHTMQNEKLKNALLKLSKTLSNKKTLGR